MALSLTALISVEAASVGIGRCGRLQRVPSTFYGISSILTSLIFFFRVRAFYADNHLATCVFALLWLSVAATNIIASWSPTGGNIASDDNISTYCTSFSVASYTSSAIITSLLHDTLVFLAISYKLSSNAYIEDSISTRVRGFFSGSSLPRFSKTLLKDGQMYYL